MARLKIDYGIDLGTTNSAICRMEQGEPVIKKTDTLKDTMPSCISVTRRGAIKAGDSAYNDMKSDKRRASKSWQGTSSNTYVEFKRTMGTDKTYHSSNLGRDLTSEELSSEVLKALKSFITDENVIVNYFKNQSQLQWLMAYHQHKKMVFGWYLTLVAEHSMLH